MTPEEESKLRIEIDRFGFVVPLIVRPIFEVEGAVRWEVIDGEHRLAVGGSLGLYEFPCWVIDVDTDTAMQLTPILNELRGSPNSDKLGALLRDLMSRQPEAELRITMPFSRERFDELIGERTVDWDALEQKRIGTEQPSNERWVERVYRMPSDAAEVVDQAVDRAKSEADANNDWQGLEYIAAEYMGR